MDANRQAGTAGRQTGRQTGRQGDRHADRPTHTHREREKQADRQTGEVEWSDGGKTEGARERGMEKRAREASEEGRPGATEGGRTTNSARARACVMCDV